MDINFSVRTQANAYAIGHQDALKDIATALLNGGSDGVTEWLGNNLKTITN